MSIGGIIAAATLAALGEVGGYVVDDESGRPLGQDVSIVLHSDTATWAGARVKHNGIFSVQAPPGDYWAQVLQGGAEVHAEKVSVPAGSILKGIRVPSERATPSLGVGGAGRPVDAPLNDEREAKWLEQLLRDARRPSPLLEPPLIR